MSAAVSDVVACCLKSTVNRLFSLHLAVYWSDVYNPKHIPVTGFVSAASMATKACVKMLSAAFLRRRGSQYSGSRGACCSSMLPPLPSPLSCSASPSRSQRLWCGLSCLTSQLAWLVNLAGQLLQCSPPRHKLMFSQSVDCCFWHPSHLLCCATVMQNSLLMLHSRLFVFCFVYTQHLSVAQHCLA